MESIKSYFINENESKEVRTHLLI